jgi:hypothetical protein
MLRDYTKKDFSKERMTVGEPADSSTNLILNFGDAAFRVSMPMDLAVAIAARWNATGQRRALAEPTGWLRVNEHEPPCDSVFLITWDGYWVKARRGNRDVVVLEWLGAETALPLSSLQNRFWMEIPAIPQDAH